LTPLLSPSAELFYDRGNHYEFLSLSHQLASPGEVPAGGAAFDFDMRNVEKAYESYNGINVKLRCVLCSHTNVNIERLTGFYFYRYFIRVILGRRMGDVIKEKDIWVHSYRMPPDSNNAIKMEVGIEDCLHIEFEYNKSK
jgi:vacuolar protein sorting-associated protein 26